MKMSKFEKKFGKYAIPNVTLVLIICYIIGYVIQLLNPNFIFFLTLDPYRILHGEVWRLVSWLLIPPSTLSLSNPFDFLFVAIMLHFYYNLGTALERTWGVYRYNLYLFAGIFITILAAFLYLGCVYLLGVSPATVEFFVSTRSFSTVYINLSIFLAFAATYPDVQVLFMMIIPVKMKWMAILDLIVLVYDLLTGVLAVKFVVAAALINFGVFYLTTRNLFRMSPKQMKRRAEFKSEVKKSAAITRHKCAICGRTEESDPGLEFRYCSKCNGNYEYCQEHLFTHEHVK